ncbi:hypothetical protein B0O99DRAFT_395288 [Bisporella sp. PMI_857]|nr:hypothetical protein B0O99DRAFT_395288 [Bisporella sp. PMI_857]
MAKYSSCSIAPTLNPKTMRTSARQRPLDLPHDSISLVRLPQGRNAVSVGGNIDTEWATRSVQVPEPGCKGLLFSWTPGRGGVNCWPTYTKSAQ